MQHIDLNAAKAAKASDRKALAILAYDNATADPAGANWRGVAELLRLALPSSKAKAIENAPESRFAPWADYPIPHNASGKRLGKSPVVLVTFADGEIVRAPAVSLPGKPINIGRAVRVAVAFYQGRTVARYNELIARDDCKRLSITDSEFVATLPIPAVVSAICETTGEEYNPAACSAMVAGLVPVTPSIQESPVAPSDYTDDDKIAAYNWLHARLHIRQALLDVTGDEYVTRDRACKLAYAVMTFWPDLDDSEWYTVPNAAPVAPSFRVPSRFLESSSLRRAA